MYEQVSQSRQGLGAAAPPWPARLPRVGRAGRAVGLAAQPAPL